MLSDYLGPPLAPAGAWIELDAAYLTQAYTEAAHHLRAVLPKLQADAACLRAVAQAQGLPIRRARDRRIAAAAEAAAAEAAQALADVCGAGTGAVRVPLAEALALQRIPGYVARLPKF